MVPYIAAGIVTGILSALLGMLMNIAIVVFLDEYDKGNVITWKTAYKKAAALYWSALFVNVTQGVLLVLLTLLLVILGIMFGVYWAFAFFAVVCSGKRGRNTFSYSRKLVQGKCWKLFGYLLLLEVVVFFIDHTVENAYTLIFTFLW